MSILIEMSRRNILIGALIVLAMMSRLQIGTFCSFGPLYRRSSVVKKEQMKGFDTCKNINHQMGILSIQALGENFPPPCSNKWKGNALNFETLFSAHYYTIGGGIFTQGL